MAGRASSPCRLSTSRCVAEVHGEVARGRDGQLCEDVPDELYLAAVAWSRQRECHGDLHRARREFGRRRAWRCLQRKLQGIEPWCNAGGAPYERLARRVVRRPRVEWNCRAYESRARGLGGRRDSVVRLSARLRCVHRAFQGIRLGLRRLKRRLRRGFVLGRCLPRGHRAKCPRGRCWVYCPALVPCSGSGPA